MKLLVKYLVFAFAISILFSSCDITPKNMDNSIETIQDSLDHIEDSLDFVDSKKSQEQIKSRVTASMETLPVEASIDGDAADDPAFWYDKVDPLNSMIIGTDKKNGLIVYNLSGEILHYQKLGRMNNVDIRQDIKFKHSKMDIVVASNRSSNSLDVFTLNPDGSLRSITANPMVISTDTIDDVYGVCLFHDAKSQRLYAFINGTNGMLLQFELFEKEKGKISAKRVRNFKFSGQVEGMVADDELRYLYISQEEKGIYKVKATPDQIFVPELISFSSEESNPSIKYDLEGIGIYKSSDTAGYIIVSSQGNFSYAVFKRQGSNDYLGSFSIVDGQLDGTEETDGLDAISLPIGNKFPNGFLVVQDGFNFDGSIKKAQNYKLIDWQQIQQIIDSWRL
jgi:3-phytase